MQLPIAVEDLHVQYRQKNGKIVDAVQGLSFAVQPGEVVGFLGPNGAGKSSTLKAMMGFLEPRQGKCDIFGLPSGSVEAKRRIGYLPEVALYYPFLTPLETLHFYGELQGMSGRTLRDETRSMLAQVGLEESSGKLNRNLSKGLLQRLGIAQALLGSPELLILDEVTSGLDPLGRRELRALLNERKSRGCTLFFSSHELAEVEMLCDRILVIHNGKFVEERNLGALREQIGRYALTFISRDFPKNTAQPPTDLGNGQFLARFANKKHLLEAISSVHGSGGQVLDVIAEEGSIEDYFIDTIERAA